VTSLSFSFLPAGDWVLFPFFLEHPNCLRELALFFFLKNPIVTPFFSLSFKNNKLFFFPSPPNLAKEIFSPPFSGGQFIASSFFPYERHLPFLRPGESISRIYPPFFPPPPCVHGTTQPCRYFFTTREYGRLLPSYRHMKIIYGPFPLLPFCIKCYFPQ